MLHGELGIEFGLEENLNEAAEGGRDHRHGILQQHGAHGAAEDDDRSRRLDDLGEFAAFQQQADDNAAQPEKQSYEAAFIHAQILRNRP